MKRIDCLKLLAGVSKEDDLVVTNLGNTPHEWLSVRPSRANLYRMNLGECTPVALGLAIALPNRRVIALDGDGNLLLNLVSLADTAYQKPANLELLFSTTRPMNPPEACRGRRRTASIWFRSPRAAASKTVISYRKLTISTASFPYSMKAAFCLSR